MTEDQLAPPNIKRLEKLAKHLESGKLVHKKFDFGSFNDSPNSGKLVLPYSCGTNGCALGECPAVFKSQWKFNKCALPVLRGTDPDTAWPDDSAKAFFSLTTGECEHLFIPAAQHPHIYGGVDLLTSATKKQVAHNILAFISCFKSNPWR